ncbi:unnamed protein product [Rangifer tarandus platyrhynchus]|uniref:Uncharacterized protein n=1 Tax=Rangifer tarandus platyrhynchus TaxID=3082113 RepID=A0AC60A4G9_RANTA
MKSQGGGRSRSLQTSDRRAKGVNIKPPQVCPAHRGLTGTGSVVPRAENVPIHCLPRAQEPLGGPGGRKQKAQVSVCLCCEGGSSGGVGVLSRPRGKRSLPELSSDRKRGAGQPLSAGRSQQALVFSLLPRRSEVFLLSEESHKQGSWLKVLQSSEDKEMVRGAESIHDIN